MSHILVVGDEPSVRKTFQEFLEEEGYDVTIVAGLAEAELLLTEHSCDVIVADISLPRVSGLNLLQRVCQIDGDIPVIMIAGESDVSSAAELMCHGAYDYVSKPVARQVLNRIVGHAIEKKHLLEDKRRLEEENQTYQAKLKEMVLETNRRLAEAHLLHEVVQAASSTLDFDEVLTRTIETLHRTRGFPHLAFIVPGEQQSDLRLHPSRIGYPREMRLPLDGSVSGRVYQSGEPLLIPDVREVPYYFEGVPNIRSALAVPVKVSGQVVAVLSAESSQLGTFDEDDLRLFSSIAAQLGGALKSASLHEETRRNLTEARLVQEVMLAATSTLNFDLALERTVKALHRALKIDRLGFLLPDEQKSELVLHPSLVGFAKNVFRIPIEGSLVGRAYRTGQPVLVRDATQKTAYLDQALDVRSALAAPVRVSGRVVAVLHAESPRKNAFGEDELHLFATIAGQLGVVLDNAQLYQKLETQAAELSQAYEELREINRLRTELVQNVGHELRTPLGLVKGYVELLLAGDLGGLPNNQHTALQVVRARTATLERLIHNLTVLQSVPHGVLRLASISVADVVRYALTEFQLVAERAGIVFQDELPAELPPVWGDRNRLGLVFSHLVDNAIKFSPDGGTVAIRAWADQEMVHVSIADQGIGIPFEHRERIFERFYQVDGSASRRFGGMGVGLALVWEIVEAHRGTVDLKSEPGKGSTFTVALPRADRINQ